MDLEEITNFVDKKIAENQEKVVIKFYEMKVKQNLRDNELLSVLNLISIRLNNLGYKVFKTDEEYNYKEKKYTVSTNELLVAIKE